MRLLGVDEVEAKMGLAAMAAVARADADFAADEAALLSAAAKIYRVDDRRLVATPEEVAGAVPKPAARERIVQAMILMALMDGDVREAELDTIHAWARALGVDEPRVRNLTQLAHGHVKLMWCDLARRSFARDVFVERLKEDGFIGLWQIVGPMVGMARDYELAQKYIALGEHRPGSFGRAYFDFILENDLGFPGEARAVPESGLWHDVTHVLAGYDTSPREEVLLVAFIAGYKKVDPFFWLFTIALQFHLGIRVSPYSPSDTGLFDAAPVLGALERGAASNTDLSAWDPWPHFARPLEEVRAELGVPPR